ERRVVRRVTGGDALDSVGHVNLVCWNVTVVPEVAGTALAAAAVHLLVLLFVDVQRGGLIVAGGGLPELAVQLAGADQLPAAYERIEEAVGVAEEGLAFAEGQIDEPVPANLMLWNGCVAGVVL